MLIAILIQDNITRAKYFSFLFSSILFLILIELLDLLGLIYLTALISSQTRTYPISFKDRDGLKLSKGSSGGATPFTLKPWLSRTCKNVEQVWTTRSKEEFLLVLKCLMGFNGNQWVFLFSWSSFSLHNPDCWYPVNFHTGQINDKSTYLIHQTLHQLLFHFILCHNTSLNDYFTALTM